MVADGRNYQGPHLYALYKYDKKIDEATVSMLYATGFLSAAISAIWAGQFADRVGRKYACLLYPALSSAANLSLHVNHLPLLILGRALGGIATTLLCSTFETWMIAEYHAVALDDSVLPLSLVLGSMTFLSSTVGILSGVASDFLVEATRLRTAPFTASSGCSCMASLLISKLWPEHKGGNNLAAVDAQSELRRSALRIIRSRRLLALGVASCCFEGSMYLFVFFWSAALKSARGHWNPGKELPYGAIFSSFMGAMMAGSLVFSLLCQAWLKKKASTGLAVIMLMASFSFLGAALLKTESLIFWAFSFFEVCVGLFIPMLGLLRSQMVVDDDIRGTIYSLYRLPTNLFVLVAHCLDKEGVFPTAHGESLADRARQEMNTARISSRRWLACSW
ncbi:hypothetical protein CDD82_6632 [Ophiocordyceps australis]|uniref:Molybdate-anion transporter n=1 Tax=Ophiocordyceps australis TaxID=1399860 RepID=A0A2C5ZVW4_9HYPO|nr:hypothetical protein CDD82_6632 [Ophiocordyceps australis]